LPGLDLLRAIAVLWTMQFHGFIVGGLGEDWHWLERYGWMGVDLFFVLSGFLIGGQLLRPLARGESPSLRDVLPEARVPDPAGVLGGAGGVPAVAGLSRGAGHGAVVEVRAVRREPRHRLRQQRGVLARVVAVRGGAFLPAVPGARAAAGAQAVGDEVLDRVHCRPAGRHRAAHRRRGCISTHCSRNARGSSRTSTTRRGTASMAC
jgi:hypothetical protein